MPTIKILFTNNSLKKKLFRQTTIYNSFRIKKKKHLVWWFDFKNSISC